MDIKNLIKKYKIKQKEQEYKKYIDEHKENVMLAFDEMINNPDTGWLEWDEVFSWKVRQRALNHDNSKYEYPEFNAYRMYYHPINDKEKTSSKTMFNNAWEHHWTNNRHHWEARQDDPDYMTEEIMLDCIENILDWMAMGYKFHDRPYQYYENNKDKIILPQCQRDFIERLIYEGIDKKYIKRENID